MSATETLTVLEKKWKEEKEERGPELADSYADSGVLDPKTLHEKVRERVPQPTGWRITVLPYMGREKSKGGIALPEQTRQQLWLRPENGRSGLRRPIQVSQGPVVQGG